MGAYETGARQLVQKIYPKNVIQPSPKPTLMSGRDTKFQVFIFNMRMNTAATIIPG
jgi:hypothetical protein